MFTGIIENLLKVKKVMKSDNSCILNISSPEIIDELKLGESVAINGACLTISKIYDDSFSVDVVNETLVKTNLDLLEEDSFINFERAMKVSDRIDGHIVQGHVEGLASIDSKEQSDSQVDLIIKLDKNLLKYCILKGSISLDGISLTIAEINNSKVKIAIIPYTYENTTIKYKNIGDILNVETDIFAKYIENFMIQKKESYE